VLVRYGAVVDPAGRSLRPEQLQRWFSDQLQRPLALEALRRTALLLQTPEGSAEQPC